jgi:hypothetical protein
MLEYRPTTGSNPGIQLSIPGGVRNGLINSVWHERSRYCRIHRRPHRPKRLQHFLHAGRVQPQSHWGGEGKVTVTVSLSFSSFQAAVGSGTRCGKAGGSFP